ncbi:ABC transporter permease [Microbacterium esteraromaticum]|uniref:ABC transporter permease n=1 Tax=Microbacterium esteraromaticum TaxID=57043 RepID=A0A7D8AGY9_9MICO|nr:ABC transporter permease [Microbacterium esteraromaticum]QMU97523.1 ABC transporter permease [Microbacterium esteraromaticum]
MSETTTLSIAQQQARPPRRGRTTALTLLLRNPSAMVGAGIILFWTLGGLITAVWSPYPPNLTDAGPLLSPPSAEHLFGTDNYGRDLFSRVLAGARVSLWTGVIAIAVSLVIGVPLGAIAGYFRGGIGMVIMRLMDMLLAFPSLLLAMALAVALGPGLASAMIAVGIVGIPEFARIMYGQTVSLREREFVESSRAIGLKDAVILFRHILPNGLVPIIVRCALGMGYAILTAAALSFIGLGAQPPLAEWGVMISDARGYIISGEWWMTLFPGIAIATSILGFNLLGDGLRDVLDPRLRTSAR